MLAGSFFGAWIANSLPKEALKLVFGFLLIYVAAYTVFGKENLFRTLGVRAGFLNSTQDLTERRMLQRQCPSGAGAG